MENVADKGETTGSGGVNNTKLVFSDDALVVDYMNALLASAPALNLDSGVIHFVHMATGTSWEPPAATAATADKAIVYDSGFSTRRADELRNENEKLKFKTELAEIEVQVLRDENDALKIEISSLTAQLNEVRGSLGTLSSQNMELQSEAASLQNRLKLATDLMNASSSLLESLEQPVNKTEDNETSQVSPQNVSTDAADTETLPPEKGSGKHNDPVNGNVIPKAAALESVGGARDDENPVALLRTALPDDHDSKKPFRDQVILSRADAHITHSAKTASKVIKQNHETNLRSRPEATSVVKTAEQYITSFNEAIAAERPAQEPTTKEVATEPDAPQTYCAERDGGLLHVDGIDGIDVESAPAPQAVVRQNLKNYSDLQNEPDAAKVAKAGHTVIL